MLPAELTELVLKDLLFYVLGLVRGVVLILTNFAPQSNYVSFDLCHSWNWYLSRK
jgi:hypothetical protein